MQRLRIFCAFERCLVDGGTVIVKLFLEISEKEQAKRFEKLLESKDTAWRVTEKERARNAHYGKYKKISDEMIRRTDMPYAPWYVIDAKDKSGNGPDGHKDGGRCSGKGA